MVKFGERMLTETVPEWGHYYVNYSTLTDAVYQFSEAHPAPSQSERQLIEKRFLELATKELQRADKHFGIVLADLEKRCVELRNAALDSDGSSSGFVIIGAGDAAASKKQRGVSFKLPAPTTDDASAGAPSADSASAGAPSADSASAGESDPVFSNDQRATSSYGAADTANVRASGSFVGTDSTSQGAFQEWFTAAENLQRFAELASEAVRKAAKKAEKNVNGIHLKHLVVMDFERCDMHIKSGDLETMIDLVKREYEHRFHRSLEQFQDAEIKKHHWQPKYRWILAAVAFFGIVYAMPILKEQPAAHSCLSLFVLVITLWITEAFPYFATALLIPLVAVPMGVLIDPATKIAATADVASHLLLGKMFENVQILVLGGLTMAKALDKSKLAAHAEAYLHHRTASRPELYMLGVMLTGCLLCIFVSNVAAPVLVLGVVRRTLNRMPRGDSCAPQRAMLLGLAFACNLGGMLSPIASPQNAVALHVLNVVNHVNITFASWMIITLPFVMSMLLVAWAVLLHVFKPFEHMKFVPLPDNTQASKQSELTAQQRVIVLVVCVVTAVLWCVNPIAVVGSPAMVALIPIVTFFGFGVLEKDDFNTLSWHLMFLLAGGSMLGLCAQTSGLLEVVSKIVMALLGGASPFGVIVIVVVSVGVITTFVSHTVAAMVLLPLIGTLHSMAVTTTALTQAPHAAVTAAASVSTADTHMGTVLILLSVLMCSGAMAFPISSFPNVNSLLAEDDQGRPWLSANDYIYPGSVVTLCCGVALIVGESYWAALFV